MRTALVFWAARRLATTDGRVWVACGGGWVFFWCLGLAWVVLEAILVTVWELFGEIFGQDGEQKRQDGDQDRQAETT